jgi:hypothetical protein
MKNNIKQCSFFILHAFLWILPINASSQPTRGLLKDLQSTLSLTQNTIASLPNTFSLLMPNSHTIQKTILSVSLIKIGYHFLKWGAEKLHTASNIASAVSSSDEENTKKVLSCKRYCLTSTPFITLGALIMWYAPKISTFAYGA